MVGGSLRDALLGREPADWDLATDARPERILALFPGAVYENRFGTVAVRREGVTYEITTFRTDHDYADFRRPHRVEFGDVDRGGPGPPRFHGQRDGLGRARAGDARRGRSSIRTDGPRRDSRAGAACLARRSGDPAGRASRRTRCG